MGQGCFSTPPERLLGHLRSETRVPRSEGFDSFLTDIQPVYTEIGAGVGTWPPPPPQLTSTALMDEAVDSGNFRIVDRRLHVWPVTYDTDSCLRLLDTFANHIVMEPSKRAHLYAEVRRRLAPAT